MEPELAPYEVVAAHIRTLISRGTLRPGEPLPSIGAVADSLECARGTVERAYRILIDEEVVIKRWRGFEVVKDKAALKKARIDAVAETITVACARVRKNGYTTDELRIGARVALESLR